MESTIDPKIEAAFNNLEIFKPKEKVTKFQQDFLQNCKNARNRELGTQLIKSVISIYVYTKVTKKNFNTDTENLVLLSNNLIHQFGSKKVNINDPFALNSIFPGNYHNYLRGFLGGLASRVSFHHPVRLILSCCGDAAFMDPFLFLKTYILSQTAQLKPKHDEGGSHSKLDEHDDLTAKYQYSIIDQGQEYVIGDVQYQKEEAQSSVIKKAFDKFINKEEKSQQIFQDIESHIQEIQENQDSETDQFSPISNRHRLYIYIEVLRDYIPLPVNNSKTRKKSDDTQKNFFNLALFKNVKDFLRHEISDQHSNGFISVDHLLQNMIHRLESSQSMNVSSETISQFLHFLKQHNVFPIIEIDSNKEKIRALYGHKKNLQINSAYRKVSTDDNLNQNIFIRILKRQNFRQGIYGSEGYTAAVSNRIWHSIQQRFASPGNSGMTMPATMRDYRYVLRLNLQDVLDAGYPVFDTQFEDQEGTVFVINVSEKPLRIDPKWDWDLFYRNGTPVSSDISSRVEEQILSIQEESLDYLDENSECKSDSNTNERYDVSDSEDSSYSSSEESSEANSTDQTDSSSSSSSFPSDQDNVPHSSSTENINLVFKRIKDFQSEKNENREETEISIDSITMNSLSEHVKSQIRDRCAKAKFQCHFENDKIIIKKPQYRDQIFELCQILDIEPPVKGVPLRPVHLRLREALMCPSAQKDFNYQCLEFLGDAILGICSAYDLLQDEDQHGNDQTRPSFQDLTANKPLARIAHDSGIDRLIIMKRSNATDDIMLSNIEDESKTYADVIEAIIGAVYTSCGITESHRIVRRFLKFIPYSKMDHSELPCISHQFQDAIQSYGSSMNRSKLKRKTTFTHDSILQTFAKATDTSNSNYFKFQGIQSCYKRVTDVSLLHGLIMKSVQYGVTHLTNERFSDITTFTIDVDNVNVQDIITPIQNILNDLFPNIPTYAIYLDSSSPHKYSGHLHWPFIVLTLNDCIRVVDYITDRLSQNEKNHLEKNINWKEAIDKGIYESKKLRMFSADKYDTKKECLAERPVYLKTIYDSDGAPISAQSFDTQELVQLEELAGLDPTLEDTDHMETVKKFKPFDGFLFLSLEQVLNLTRIYNIHTDDWKPIPFNLGDLNESNENDQSNDTKQRQQPLDPKGELTKFCSQRFIDLEIPVEKLSDGLFTATVFIEGESYGSGQGRNKKTADKAASLETLNMIAPTIARDIKQHWNNGVLDQKNSRVNNYSSPMQTEMMTDVSSTSGENVIDDITHEKESKLNRMNSKERITSHSHFNQSDKVHTFDETSRSPDTHEMDTTKKDDQRERNLHRLMKSGHDELLVDSNSNREIEILHQMLSNIPQDYYRVMMLFLSVLLLHESDDEMPSSLPFTVMEYIYQQLHRRQHENKTNNHNNMTRKSLQYRKEPNNDEALDIFKNNGNEVNQRKYFDLNEETKHGMMSLNNGDYKNDEEIFDGSVNNILSSKFKNALKITNTPNNNNNNNNNNNKNISNNNNDNNKLKNELKQQNVINTNYSSNLNKRQDSKPYSTHSSYNRQENEPNQSQNDIGDSPHVTQKLIQYMLHHLDPKKNSLASKYFKKLKKQIDERRLRIESREENDKCMYKLIDPSRSPVSFPFTKHMDPSGYLNLEF